MVAPAVQAKSITAQLASDGRYHSNPDTWAVVDPFNVSVNAPGGGSVDPAYRIKPPAGTFGSWITGDSAGSGGTTTAVSGTQLETALSFPTKLDQALDTVIESDAIVISDEGHELQVRRRSSETNDSWRQLEVQIGTQNITWWIKTVADSGPPAELGYIQDWSAFSAHSDDYPSAAAGNAIHAADDLQLDRNPDLSPPGFDPDVYPYQRTFTTTDPRESGGISLRLENRRGVSDGQDRTRVSYRVDEDAEVREFVGDNPFPTFVEDKEYWMSLPIKFDSTWPTSVEANGRIITIGWGITSGGSGQGLWILQAIPTSSGVRIDKIGGIDGNTSTGYIMTRGDWYDMICRSVTSRTDGVLEMWIRDKDTLTTTKVLDEAGPLVYGDVHDGSTAQLRYLQWNGIYGGKLNDDSETYIMYHGTHRWYEGTDGFNIVLPPNS